MAASANGSNLNKGKGTLTDANGNVFTRSSFVGNKGSQVTKGGASTSFPGAACLELWWKNGLMQASKYGGGWYKYTGTAWVSVNPVTDM